MKLSESYFYTLREDAKDEESVSGNLLVKSGMFKKIGKCIYMKMPLGQKVYENVQKIDFVDQEVWKICVFRVDSKNRMNEDIRVRLWMNLQTHMRRRGMRMRRRHTSNSMMIQTSTMMRMHR